MKNKEQCAKDYMTTLIYEMKDRDAIIEAAYKKGWDDAPNKIDKFWLAIGLALIWLGGYVGGMGHILGHAVYSIFH